MRTYKRLAVLAFVLTTARFAPPAVLGQKNPANKPRPGGTLRMKPLTNIFKQKLDPAGSPYRFVIEQLYDGLVRLDADLNVVPAAAEYWVISEDGKRITFYLNKGVTFHSGRELTAEDVKFSLERLIRGAGRAPYYQYFAGKVVGVEAFHEDKADGVEGFRVVDKYTFEIEWSHAYVSGLYLLGMSFCKILPRDLVLEKGDDFFLKPCGTGAFKFAYWVRSPGLDPVGIRLERNEAYFGRPPHLDAIEFSPYYTLTQFTNGEVHIIPFLSDSLSGDDFQILEYDSLETAFLGFSCRLFPLDRVDVRIALSIGIDEKRLVEAAYTTASVPLATNNYISPKIPGFFPREESDLYDPEKARRILEAGGFIGEEGFPELTVYFFLPKKEIHFKVYRELRRQLALLGIGVQMRYPKSREEMKSVKSPYLVFMEWPIEFPDPENIVRPLFHSESEVNLTAFHYQNSDIDALIKKSELEMSWEKRVELFRKMEAILASEMPAVPLYTVRERIALQPEVRGVKITPLGVDYLDARDVWLAR